MRHDMKQYERAVLDMLASGEVYHIMDLSAATGLDGHDIAIVLDVMLSKRLICPIDNDRNHWAAPRRSK